MPAPLMMAHNSAVLLLVLNVTSSLNGTSGKRLARFSWLLV